jgi:hypothetical protein
MRMKRLGLIAAALILAASPASAGVIDFEDIGVLAGGNILAPDFLSDGYSIRSTEHLHVINNLSPTVSWNDSAWLGIHGLDNQVTFTRQNGGAFSLVSLEASEFFGSPNGTEVLVTGTDTTGSILTLSFSLDDIGDGSGPLNDFQTINFSSDWQNLSSVKFQASAGGGERWYALDNIVTVEAVPEPTTWTMLASGCAIFGFFFRSGRRRLVSLPVAA